MHHMLGVIFILNPIVALLITARSGILTLIREVLHFDKDDVKFLVKFPAELIGKEPEGMPKQGFYNGGERMNILLQALLWLGFVVSGLTLWLGAGHKMGRGPRERGQARDSGAHSQMSEAIHLPIFP